MVGSWPLTTWPLGSHSWPLSGRPVLAAQYWPPSIGCLLLAAYPLSPRIGRLAFAYHWPLVVGRLAVAACYTPHATGLLGAYYWPPSTGLPWVVHDWPPTTGSILPAACS